MSADFFAFSGKAFVMTYEGLTAMNVYSSDEHSLIYEITEGVLKGNRATADFTWRHLHGKTSSRGKKRTRLRLFISMISRRRDRFLYNAECRVLSPRRDARSA
ncbi:hypothetical protein ACMAVI_001814 [Burkholderia cenocepacia]